MRMGRKLYSCLYGSLSGQRGSTRLKGTLLFEATWSVWEGSSTPLSGMEKRFHKIWTARGLLSQFFAIYNAHQTYIRCNTHVVVIRLKRVVFVIQFRKQVAFAIYLALKKTKINHNVHFTSIVYQQVII